MAKLIEVTLILCGGVVAGLLIKLSSIESIASWNSFLSGAVNGTFALLVYKIGRKSKK